MARPRWRRITPNHGCEKPSQVVVLDTETIDPVNRGRGRRDVQRLRLGCAIAWRPRGAGGDRREEFDFTTKGRFWDWLYSKLMPKGTTILFAHNAYFDFSVVGGWKELEAGRLTAPFVCLDDPPTVFKFQAAQGRLVVLDSLNFLTAPLDALGAELGLPKVALPAFDEPDAAWWKRCRRDAQILEEAVRQWLALVDGGALGCFAHTASRQAWNSWRHVQPDALPVVHGNDDVKRLEGDCYYGAWNEVLYSRPIYPEEFRRADGGPQLHDDGLEERHGPVHHLDAQAFYPSIMKDHVYPQQYLDWSAGCSPDRLAQLLKTRAVCASVLLETDDEEFPVRRDGRTRYAVGRFWTCLCSPELQRALDAGAVRKVHQLATYSLGVKFDQWVDRLWALRRDLEQSGRPLQARGVKTLMNSLSGRFGQRLKKWRPAPEESPLALWGRWFGTRGEPRVPCEFRALGGVVQWAAAEDYADDACPVISAHITSYGRERLRRWREIAGVRETYYSATDALFVSTAGRERLERAGLVAPGVLGALQVKGVHASAAFLGPGRYSLEGRLTAAGLSRRAERIGVDVYRQQQFSKAKSLLTDRGPEEIVVEWVDKKLEPLTLGRAETLSGWTAPVVLDEVAPPF